MPAFTLVPKADYKLDWESWRPVGLGGTGSFDVIVENAFVPDYRVLRFSDAVGSTAPGAESNTNPLYRISLLTGVAFALAMPAVGAASGSLERFIDENKVRQTHGAVVLGEGAAIDLIFDAAGGRCLQHGHPLQRAWRDVAAINHHISLNFDAVMSMYGQFVFGLPLEGQY